MANLSDIHVGDQVQITAAAIDITNGVRAGSRYTEGSSQWGYVQGIYPNWTASYGPYRGQRVTKIRITGTDRRTVVWQVTADHVSSNIIHANGCGPVQPEPSPPVAKPTPAPTVKIPPPSIEDATTSLASQRGPIPVDAFVTTPESDTWLPPSGDTRYSKATRGAQNGSLRANVDAYGRPTDTRTKVIPDAPFAAMASVTPLTYVANQIKVPAGVPKGMTATAGLERLVGTKMADQEMKRLMLNDDPGMIQNAENYPRVSTVANYNRLLPARYDYLIRPNDPNYAKASSLEDQLMEARAAFGLPVHGNEDMAKTMRYFLYNRFKVPDTNLAHNKSFTHIFFTRPDLNILEGPMGNLTIAPQCRHHSETSMLWLQNPSLFKLLVNGKRCGDANNFNLLLSNAASAVAIEDETLSYIEAGRSWGEHAIQYGDGYTGQTAGELSVTFVDDKDYSVISLLKLWITYIHNVSRGAWIPSYNLEGNCNQVSKMINGSHVYTRTLDYAASIDVIKVGEDGSEILYWTKYYGVFPITTGAGSLSWDSSGSPGDAPKPPIRFRYSYKRDRSPVDLLTFNRNAMVTAGTIGRIVDYERQWSDEFNHSNRPFVGTPFIQFKLPSRSVALAHDEVVQQQTAKLRLQFLEAKSVIGDRDRDIFRPSRN